MTDRHSVALGAAETARAPASVAKLRVAANDNPPARNAEMAAHDAGYDAFNERLARYMRGETRTPVAYIDETWDRIKLETLIDRLEYVSDEDGKWYADLTIQDDEFTFGVQMQKTWSDADTDDDSFVDATCGDARMTYAA